MNFPETLGADLKNGSIAVIPTDTIYGIVASAWNKESVTKVYEIKNRAPEKPCIILIDSPEKMRDFGVSDSFIKKVTECESSKPTSFIVPISRNDIEYLDRGTGTLAFRIPKDSELNKLLCESGPLIAPSANPQGLPPAKNIEEAKKYFTNETLIFIDQGEITNNHSSLIDMMTNTILRA